MGLHLQPVSYTHLDVYKRQEVTCSKGTYIRTLLEDIADALGQKGTMSALRLSLIHI